MAGTRLRIVSIFLVSLFIWLAFTIRASRLHEDDVFQRQLRPAFWRWLALVGWSPRRLPHFDHDQWNLHTLSSPTEFISLDIMVVTANAASRHRWQAILNGVVVSPTVVWNVSATDSTIMELCANPFLAHFHELDDMTSLVSARRAPDLVLCDADETATHDTRVVWVPLSPTTTTTLYYPSVRSSDNDDYRRRELELLVLPRWEDVPSSSWKVYVVLVVEPGIANWKEIVEHVNEWMDGQGMDGIPCVRGVDVHVQRRELEGTSSRATARPLVLSDLETQPIVADVSDLECSIYVPSSPVHFVVHNQTSHSVIGDTNRHWYVVPTDTAVTTASLFDLDATLRQIQDQVWSHCFQLPTSSDDPTNPMTVKALSESDTVTIPSLYQRLYFHRALNQRYQSVMVAMEQAHALVESSAVYQFGPDVAARWTAAWDNVRHATTHAAFAAAQAAPDAGRHVHAAQGCLDRAEAGAATIQSPHTAVRADFPPEQYAAILAPLLFPMLVPVLVTLVREVQRYRTLSIATGTM